MIIRTNPVTPLRAIHTTRDPNTVASQLGRKGTADHLIGVNLAPLKDLLAAVQAAQIPIWVCGACAVARQIGAGDLVAGASIKGMPDYIKAVAERDRNVAF